MTQQIPPPLNLQYATQNTGGLSVRAVGLAQRRMIWAFLGAVATAAMLMMGGSLANIGGIGLVAFCGALFLIWLGAVATMMVFIYQMAAAMGWNTALCVICTIGMIIPYLNLIPLLVVNHKATKFLKFQRIKVGFMGARVADLPPA